jgi:hypothetical protein
MKIEFETYSRDGNEDLDEEPGDRVFDVLVLHLQEVLCQLVHELKEKVFFFFFFKEQKMKLKLKDNVYFQENLNHNI